MEKLLQGRLNNNFSDEKISAFISKSKLKQNRQKTLSDYTKNFDLAQGSIENISFNTELSNAKTRMIAQKLARAIDKNSVEQVKKIKDEYGKEKEFVKAKKFLNDKCKQVWNVYDNPENVPLEAMKALGITNQPELSFLLDNTVKYFEKDGGNTTVKTILSILENKNMDYTIDDIYKYLHGAHLKEKCNYNKNTIKYLILTGRFKKKELIALGADNNLLKDVIKSLTLKQKLHYMASNLSLCFN